MIQTTLRTLGTLQLIALGVLAASVAVLAYLAFTTQSALCAFRQDIQQRHDQTAQILDEHPGDPVRAFGLTIPRSQLLSNLASQDRTLNSLDGLYC